MSGFIIIIVFLLSFIFCAFDFSRNTKYKNKAFYFLIFILFIISATKDSNTCFDTYNYTNHFLSSPEIYNFNPLKDLWYEPGYSILESLIKTFTNNPFYLFATISIISLSLLTYIIRTYSPYPFLSLFIYISLFYFKRDIITIRYGLSALLLCVGLFDLIKNKPVKAYLWFTVSFLFHYSALSILAFIPFYTVLKNKPLKISGLIVGGAFILSVFGLTIFQIILVMANHLPDFLSFGIGKGLRHLDEEESGGVKQIIPYIPFLIFVHYIKINGYMKDLIIVLLFAIFCMIELNQVASFARVNQLFLTPIIIFIPLLLSSTRNKTNYGIIYSYSSLFCSYMFVRICFFNSGGFINVHW